MFGHHWDPGQATIVASRVKSTTGDGMVSTREFVADVQVGSEPLFRAVVQIPTIATNFWDPSVGDSVGVLVERKSRKVKFDKSDPALNAATQTRKRDDAFARAAAAPPGNPT
jgi:hypothetical protein